MAWYLAPSLAAARRELNELFPNRSTASDGTIGDTAHSERKSDHNPDKDGSVNAWDVTHDPDGGPDCNELVAHIVKRRDPRVAYLIWNGRIWRSYDKSGLPAWTPEAYTGTNPHTKHAHISVKRDRTSEQNTATWWRDLPSRTPSLLSFTLPPRRQKMVILEPDDADAALYLRFDDGALIRLRTTKDVEELRSKGVPQITIATSEFTALKAG